MKKMNRITVGFGAIVLVCIVVVGGFSASATGGDQSDPLITLSYLTQVVKPELMEKVDEQVAANEQALTDKLDAAIDDYSEQMKQVLSQGTGESSAFTIVSLAAGQTIMPEAGGELLLRSGNAKVISGSSPVMLDSTAGSSLENGGAMKTNHLYVVPLAGAGITASSACVLMVRGMYAVV